MNKDIRKIIKTIKVDKGFVKNGGVVYVMECLNCRKYFKMGSSDYKRGRGFYCSIKCRSQNELFKKEFRGENNPMFGRIGKEHPRFGVILTEEIKEKIRKKAIGRVIPEEVRKRIGRKGEENKNYKGGHKEAAKRYRQKNCLRPHYRLDNVMGVSIWQALKKKKAYRKWENLVDYTIEGLMEHLEKQFDDKMNWDNYGSYWQIDHKKPRSLFSYDNSEDEEFKKCWALENLQPLEKTKNIIKSNKFIS